MSNITDPELDPLTTRVLEFQRLSAASHDPQADSHATRLLSDLVESVWLIAYRYPVMVKVLEEEDAAEFVLRFHNRIPTIIREFRYEHLSFESYVKKVVFWQSGSFLQRKRKRDNRCPIDVNEPETIQRILFESQGGPPNMAKDQGYGDTTWEALCTSEEAPFYAEGSAWNLDHPLCKELKQRMQHSVTLRKRLLQLILLCSDRLQSCHIAVLARFMGMQEYTLASLVAKAIEKGYRRVEIDDDLRGVRDAHFQEALRRLGELEMLEHVCADPYYIEGAKRRYERARKLFLSRCKESRGRPSAVTHAMVASLMSIPKGTVDSGMVSLRNLIMRIMDDCG